MPTRDMRLQWTPSIHQARWLLFSGIGLVFGVAAVGLIIG